jgi:pimeloyl-ACP methyl ester carboxylesterase
MISDADEPAFIPAEDGTPLAYVATPARPGIPGPGVVFLGGFMSDMTGQKATVLEDWARARGRAFLRLDYAGHGRSGGAFRDGTVGRWRDDARTVIAHAGRTVAGLDGPLVLVGSSMGGWVAALLAREMAASSSGPRVAGLVTVAAAPDFTHDLMPERLGPDAMAEIERNGHFEAPSEYSDEPYVITRALIEDGNANRVLGGPIPFDGPARLIHGTGDPDVPWTQSQKLMGALASDDVELILVKGGGHRLSEPHDLERMVGVIEGMCDQLSASSAASPAR